jgi:non-heme chloroperoxidase
MTHLNRSHRVTDAMASQDFLYSVVTLDPGKEEAGVVDEFWPASHAAACAVLAPMGDSIVLADDGHAANSEQPKAVNEALLSFLRAG